MDHPEPLQHLPWPADHEGNAAFEQASAEWWAGTDLRRLRGEPNEDTRPWPDAAQLMHLAWARRASPRALPMTPCNGPAPFVEQLARWMQAMEHAQQGSELELKWEDHLTEETQRRLPTLLAPEALGALGLLPLLRPDLSLKLGEQPTPATGILREIDRQTQRQTLGAMILSINMPAPTNVTPNSALVHLIRAIKSPEIPLSHEAQALLAIPESERPTWIRRWLQHQHVGDGTLRDLRALQRGLPDSLEELLSAHPAPLTAWRAVAISGEACPLRPLMDTPPLIDAALPEQPLEELSVNETVLRWSLTMLRVGMERAAQVDPDHLLHTGDAHEQSEWPSFRAQAHGIGLQMLSRILPAEALNPEQRSRQHEALRWAERRQVSADDLPGHLIHLSVFGEALPEARLNVAGPDADHLRHLMRAGLHLLRAWEVLLPGRIRMAETIPSPWEETGTENRTVPGTNGTIIMMVKQQPLGWKLSPLPLRARLWQGLTETFRRHRHVLAAPDARRLAVQLALLSPRREEDTDQSELIGRAALTALRTAQDWRGPEQALAPLISALRKDIRAMEHDFPQIKASVVMDLNYS